MYKPGSSLTIMFICWIVVVGGELTSLNNIVGSDNNKQDRVTGLRKGEREAAHRKSVASVVEIARERTLSPASTAELGWTALMWSHYVMWQQPSRQCGREDAGSETASVSEKSVSAARSWVTDLSTHTLHYSTASLLDADTVSITSVIGLVNHIPSGLH